MVKKGKKINVGVNNNTNCERTKKLPDLVYFIQSLIARALEEGNYVVLTSIDLSAAIG